MLVSEMCIIAHNMLLELRVKSGLDHEFNASWNRRHKEDVVTEFMQIPSSVYCATGSAFVTTPDRDADGYLSSIVQHILGGECCRHLQALSSPLVDALEKHLWSRKGSPYRISVQISFFSLSSQPPLLASFSQSSKFVASSEEYFLNPQDSLILIGWSAECTADALRGESVDPIGSGFQPLGFYDWGRTSVDTSRCAGPLSDPRVRTGVNWIFLGSRRWQMMRGSNVIPSNSQGQALE